MSADRTVQFGHSDSERLVLSNFKWDGDTYSADANVCAGGFNGAARIYGHAHEFDRLYNSLSQMSASQAGEAAFENLDRQLKLHCSIGSRGTVHLKVSVSDHCQQVECVFDTDLTSLDRTVAALANII